MKAIFCARGGYGSARLLPHLQYEVIRQNPKIFWGYSDITALHTAVSRYAKLITFHGPMIEELGKGIDSLSLSSLISYSIRIQPFYLHQNVSYLALTVQLQVR